MVRQCKVCGKLSSTHPDLSFHRFPVDPEKRNIWLSLTGITASESIHLPKHPEICSSHFHPSDLIMKANGLRYIKRGANPKPIDYDTENEDYSSNSSDSSIHETPPSKSDTPDTSVINESVASPKSSDASENGCQQWKESLGFVGDHKFANLTPEEAYSRIRICSSHFGVDAFSSSGKRLVKSAVPVKLDVPGPSQMDTSLLKTESSVQIDIKEEIIPSSIINATASQAVLLQSSVATHSGIYQKYLDEYNKGYEIPGPSNIGTPLLKSEVPETDIKQELISDYDKEGYQNSGLSNIATPLFQAPTQTVIKEEVTESASGIATSHEGLQTNLSTQNRFYPIYLQDYSNESSDLSNIETPVLNVIPGSNTGITRKRDASTQSGLFQEFMEDKAGQTPGYLLDKAPRVLELKRKIVELQNSLRSYKRRCDRPPTIREIIEFLEENYPPEAIMLIKNQLLLLDKSPQGARYSEEFKQFALTLFLLGPKTYKKLANIIRLPSPSTLKRITRRWKIDPGFNDLIFKIFELRVPLMAETSKDCILCVDEMPIKTFLFYNISRDAVVGFEELYNKKSMNIATHALVLMARGISHNWKQPITYFFCKNSTSVEDLAQIIVESIRRLKRIGLNVLAITSDHAPNFYKLAKNCFKLTVETPYFYVDNSLIFYLFHVPYLLRSTRNLFFTNSFHLDDGVANISYLETVYNLDKLKKYKLAPKLTEEHIYPNNFKKMKVKLASDVFSHSVAVAIHTYIEFNKISPEAKATANFIENMNKLYDILNSSNLETCEPFTGTPLQFQFLRKMDKMFSNLKVINKNGVNVTTTFKFIYGWRLTISSVLKLWDTLRSKKHRHLLTSNLNQECLENYFTEVRKFCGNARNPTAVQFTRAFKKLFILNHFQETESSDCLEDATDILCSISPELLKEGEFLNEKQIRNSSLLVTIQTSDYQDLLKEEGNAVRCVGEYLLRKCLLKHSCDVCIGHCNSLEPFQGSDGSMGGLTVPVQIFINYLMCLENNFVTNFNYFCIQSGVGNSMLKHFADVKFQHPCPNFPYKYMLSLYIRVRIYYTLKFANREIKFQRLEKERASFKILENL